MINLKRRYFLVVLFIDSFTGLLLGAVLSTMWNIVTELAIAIAV